MSAALLHERWRENPEIGLAPADYLIDAPDPTYEVHAESTYVYCGDLDKMLRVVTVNEDGTAWAVDPEDDEETTDGEW